MILALSPFDTERRGFSLAHVLYRLTGIDYFSPAAQARRARFQRTLNELEQMNDGELAELGLHRCDIRRVAWETSVTGSRRR